MSVSREDRPKPGWVELWLTVLIIALLVAVLLPVARRVRVQANRATGELIGAALDRYRRDHGRYPPTLDALVPRYLSENPQTTRWSTKVWSYGSATGDEYVLSFESGGFPNGSAHIYDSESGTWVLDDR